MNTLFFDNQVTSVIKSIDLTEQKLNSDQDFLDPVRRHFDKSLETLLHLLGQDAYRKYTGKNWAVAHHVVKFGSLYSRLERIRQKIFTLKTPPYFTKKIERTVLPLLESRIKEVTQHLGSLEPLPFKKGQDRRQFLIKARNNLTPSISDDTQCAEKEYFHLLGNSLDKQKVEKINISPYIGNLEIYSLSSWADVISSFIGEGNSSEVAIGNQILEVIKQATSIALKMNFIYKLPQIKKVNDISKEKKYYEDLMKLKQAEENGKQLTTCQSTFLQTYNLDKKEDLPASVLINEITWAMLSSIRAMKTNEERIFPVGTREHSITVHVSCLEQPSYLCPKGKYQYKIFNTGDGLDQFHYTEQQNGKLMVRPLIFHDLPQTVFSYSFLFELTRQSLQSHNVADFYALHDRVLVQEGGAKKDKLSGAFHFTQEYGTCTYSSVEAWVNSYLTEDQIKHLELVKAKFSTCKQEKIVGILEQKAIQENLKNSTQSKGSSAPKTKNQKLEDGRLLLELGKKHLQQVSQVFSNLGNTKGLGTQNPP